MLGSGADLIESVESSEESIVMEPFHNVEKTRRKRKLKKKTKRRDSWDVMNSKIREEVGKI